MSANDNNECKNRIEFICNLNQPSLQESISCISKHLSQFQTVCYNLAKFIQLNIYNSCGSDFNNYCLNSNNDEMKSFSCLTDNFRKLDYKCRKEFILIGYGESMCDPDINYFCSDITNFNEIPNCLSNVESDRLTYGCSGIIYDYQTCVDQIDGKPCWLVESKSHSARSEGEGILLNIFVFAIIVLFLISARVAYIYRQRKREIKKFQLSEFSTNLASAYYIVDSDSHHDDGIALTATPVTVVVPEAHVTTDANNQQSN